MQPSLLLYHKHKKRHDIRLSQIAIDDQINAAHSHAEQEAKQSGQQILRENMCQPPGHSTDDSAIGEFFSPEPYFTCPLSKYDNQKKEYGLKGVIDVLENEENGTLTCKFQIYLEAVPLTIFKQERRHNKNQTKYYPRQGQLLFL